MQQREGVQLVGGAGRQVAHGVASVATLHGDVAGAFARLRQRYHLRRETPSPLHHQLARLPRLLNFLIAPDSITVAHGPDSTDEIRDLTGYNHEVGYSTFMPLHYLPRAHTHTHNKSKHLQLFRIWTPGTWLV